MRFVLFVLLCVLCLVLQGSVFSVANIGGIVPDLLLVVSLCVVLLEKTSAGIVFAAAAGMLYDILFSPYLGFNAFACTLTVAVAYAVLRGMERPRPFYQAAVGFAAYIAEQLIAAAIIAAAGNRFDFLYMLARYMLPGALMTAALMYPSYWLLRILYQRNWLKPRKPMHEDFLK